ncbi:MAG TPA: hypothetical protein VIZ17_09295 [Acetobacteraceae bacterium]
MSDSATAKQDWVSRVLGVTIPAPGQKAPTTGAHGAAPDWNTARVACEAALAAVDQQIAALQLALRKTNDDGMLVISEIGLPAMMAEFKPRLVAALQGAGDGGGASMKAGGTALLKAVQDVSLYIEGDKRIAACDANTVGVAVSIRSTLGPALAALSAAAEAGMQ